MELVQRKSIKMIRVLKCPFCEASLRGLEVFSLEKRRHQGDFIASFQYLSELMEREIECFYKGL